MVGRLVVRSSGKSKETEDSLGVGGPVITWIARASHRGERGRSLVDVDNRNEIRQFLTSRQAKITPEQAGLPTYGSNRRVAGLRREEVALLAGVSVDYYTRLERGNLGGVSEAVLDALAQALQLDEAERGHLFDLARAVNTTASEDSDTPSTKTSPRSGRMPTIVKPTLVQNS